MPTNSALLKNFTLGWNLYVANVANTSGVLSLVDSLLLGITDPTFSV
jgi:hypothetical protein